jgi:hypothetical protein
MIRQSTIGKKATMKTKRILIAAFVGALSASTALAQTAPKMKMTTDIPPEITTPDIIKSRIGTLKLFDGYPDDATTQKVYDNLDFQRGVQAFLNAMPGAALTAFRPALRELGGVDGNVIIFEQLMDSKALWLTANTTVVYYMSWVDTKNGPIVAETPPNTLGVMDDHWFRYVSDFGNAGPDKGRGGKFLILPPGYKGAVPDGYFVLRPATYSVWLAGRGFLVDGDPKPAVTSIEKYLHIYPLAQAANPPVSKFTNVSGVPHNTVHANNFHFFEEVNDIVQEEPAEALDPETLGLLASIGIEKGKPFAPDARMKKILSDAAVVGNVTARALTFRTRIKEAYYYPNSAWYTLLPGGSYDFLLQPGVRNLDARVLMHYYATGITPAMSMKMVGVGSQYAAAVTDSKGSPLDGSKTYKIHLPPNIPVKQFWSFTVYDNQTRSMLQTDQQFPSVNSTDKGVVTNPDGSVDVWFGPALPKGVDKPNWVQTIPGKGWNVLFRLYGPLEPWFDKTWRPGEFELVTSGKGNS